MVGDEASAARQFLEINYPMDNGIVRRYGEGAYALIIGVRKGVHAWMDDVRKIMSVYLPIQVISKKKSRHAAAGVLVYAQMAELHPFACLSNPPPPPPLSLACLVS